jgi:hypothetical protein
MKVDHPISAMTAAHPDSPLQTTYEGNGFSPGGATPVADAYRSRAQHFVDAVNANGGVTQPATSRDIAEGTPNLPVGDDAKRPWYGVGGASDYRAVPPGQEAPHYRDLPRVPETVISEKQFSTNDALHHVLQTEGHNIVREQQPLSRKTPAVYAGGWKEKGNVVLDQSLSLPSKNTALRMARDVGERAVFEAQTFNELDPHTGKPLP